MTQAGPVKEEERAGGSPEMGCNDGATCKDTHKFPMILTEFGYCGGYSNGYRIGYGNEYAHGKKFLRPQNIVTPELLSVF
ncbi:MAG: hypothetical protein ACYDEF_04590 [Methanosarcina sp.]